MTWRMALLPLVASIPAQGSSYVGMAVCAKCHAEIHRQWTHSRHSKMVQPATMDSAQRDFKLARVNLRGTTYGLREREGVFYITETFLTAKPTEHRHDLTLAKP